MGTGAMSQSRAYHAKNHIMNYLGVSGGALYFFPKKFTFLIIFLQFPFLDLFFKISLNENKNKNATSKFINFFNPVFGLLSLV